MNDRKLTRLRDRARHKCQELEALLVVGNMMTPDARKSFDIHLGSIKTSSLKQLETGLNEIESRIALLRRELGAIVPNSEIVELLRFVNAAPAGKAALAPKHLIQSLFSRAGYSFPHFEDFRPHVRLMIYRTKPITALGEIHWQSFETTLYEDLCALFNDARERSVAAGAVINQRGHKAVNALLRATAGAAFYFVEAYLNGIAYDHVVSKGKFLSEDERVVLTEWDTTKSRASYLSLRSKLLKYPRIIVGSSHPPLTEDNCPEMKLICDQAKKLRDSIVHASPHPEGNSHEPLKERQLLNCDTQMIEQIVDSAVGLVRKVEVVVAGSDQSVFWLHDRLATGLFPNSVFR